ncbi:biotin transporter BioY [Streptococcus zalophi]|uniref:Biotin transporter n=1 Tax=Streptococcus zalophi TaxID=640031 RepID=A0A934P8Z8_9STRE|nr:biotin transporter BioY [Streptococcus zalophi]MBJ8349178.1 biotin transporter BioY [Streptococcus zalophi]MCR8967200.1 biotin transporter BioY [Streptococcus zalophi]
MRHSKTFSLAITAIAAAMIAILAQITIPFGSVPFSLQTLAIGLVATLLKPKEATTATLLYLVLGAIGIPVFAGGASGFQVLFGPTGGFLWGMLGFSFVTSILTNTNSSLVKVLIANILGDIIVFVFGVIGLMVVAKLNLSSAIMAGVVPFIIPEILKLALVTLLSKPLFNVLRKQDYVK